MANVETKTRIDQVVIAMGDDGIVRGVNVLEYTETRIDGELAANKHKTVPFDPAAIESILPSAPHIKRALDLEAALADSIKRVDEYKAKVDELSVNLESAQNRLKDYLGNTQLG